MAQPNLEMMPNRRVFVWRSTIRTALALLVVALAVVAAAPATGLDILPVIVLVVASWALLVGLAFVNRSVRFSKTRYEFFDDKVVYRTGTLFSDSTIDLKFANVTQITLRRPFIEHKLYATGHIRIQAAGSVGAEVDMQSIDDPVTTFEMVEKYLVANGFSLSRGSVIQREKPGLVGCLYDLGAPVLGTAFVVLVYVPDLLAAWATMMEIGEFSTFVETLMANDPTDTTRSGALVAVLALGLLMLGGGISVLIFTGLKLMDLLERTYTIHDDVIEYEDGFLSTSRSLIPMENLADVEVAQSVVQRVLGISTVAVSCQGAGADIRLTAVPRGAEFKANLETLIDEVGERHRASLQDDARVDRVDDRADLGVSEEPRQTSNLPSIEARMSWKRMSISGALGVAGLLLIVAATSAVGAATGSAESLGLGFTFGTLVLMAAGYSAVRVGVNVYANRYRVDSNKVVKAYELFSKKETEFTIDKVSSVTIRRGPFDRLLGTATITFRSIGSVVPMQFKHVDDAEAVIEGALRRLGLEPPRTSPVLPSYTPGLAIRALDGWLILLATLLMLSFSAVFVHVGLAVTLVVLCGIGVFGRLAYLHVVLGRSRLFWEPRYALIERGVFIRTRSFAPREHIRGMGARNYLGTRLGTVWIRSGGNVVNKLGYLDDAWNLQDRFDRDLWADDGRAAFVPDVSMQRLPSTFAAALRGFLFSLFSVVLAPFFVVVVAVAVVRAKHTNYQLQRPRVARHFGIFLKSRETILVSRIDHLTSSRGIVNRITSTGAIGVRTIGSSGTDLEIKDVPDSEPFYQAIEKRTREND